MYISFIKSYKKMVQASTHKFTIDLFTNKSALALALGYLK